MPDSQSKNILKLIFPICILLLLRGPEFIYALPDQNTFVSDSTLKIGFLIPDKKSIAAVQGAALAVKEANRKGGRSFEMVVKSMEGPWGAGSRQAVNLIFDKEVVAMIGSIDGRNAHLIEQVSAKTHIVFMSVWSGDPTLSQAFVPWFFNCVPNDLQQADELIEEIYDKDKIDKVVVMSENDYDSKLSVDSFLKKLKSHGKAEPGKIFYYEQRDDFGSLSDQISKYGANAVVIFGLPASSLKLIRYPGFRKPDKRVFASLTVMGEQEFSADEWKAYENAVLVSSGQWFNQSGADFRREFSKEYGYEPGPVAAYAFDGMSLLIQAISKKGTETEQIKKYLSEVNYNGVTGIIKFDDKGNRTERARLMKVTQGIPVLVEK